MGNEQTNTNDGNWEKQEGNTFWKPSVKGEQLVGTVVEVVDDQRFGKQYFVKTDKGVRMKTPSHKVLQSRMDDAVVGTVVKIVYTGQEPASVKGNRPTEMYEVYFQKKGAGGNPSTPSKAEQIEAFL